MNKIRRVSLLFRVLFMALFAMLPLIELLGWLNAPTPLHVLLWQLQVIPTSYQSLAPAVFPAYTKVLGLMVSMVPMVIELFVIYFLIKLFKLYEIGEIFSFSNVRYIRNIGYTLLLYQLVHPFYEFALGPILTWHNPPGHRIAMVTFGQTNFGILLVALLVILISWIMAEGCKLREEQQLTI